MGSSEIKENWPFALVRGSGSQSWSLRCLSLSQLGPGCSAPRALGTSRLELPAKILDAQLNLNLR